MAMPKDRDIPTYGKILTPQCVSCTHLMGGHELFKGLPCAKYGYAPEKFVDNEKPCPKFEAKKGADYCGRWCAR
jgi:hypothetical protein